MNIKSPEEFLKKSRSDPVWFVKEVFGTNVIGKQEEILMALAEPNVREVHIRSCHASGKSWTCARAVSWFLASYPQDSIVVTTAPTWPQVEQILWREVASSVAQSKITLGGRLMKTRWDIGPKWYAIGAATSEDTAVNLAGFHAAHVMVIIDEADGVPEAIWNAIDGLTTSAHVLVLAIGNPINPTSAWRKRVEASRSIPTRKLIRISANDVLPFTDQRDKNGNSKFPYLLQREWVEERRRPDVWGEGSPMWQARVEAEWPDQSTDTLLPMGWLIAAKGRNVERGPRTYGVDVARFGTDRTVRTLLQGGWLEFSKSTKFEDTVQTAGRVISDISEYEPVAVAIDAVGVGGGVVDQVKSRVPHKSIYPFNANGKSSDPDKYSNISAEWWWKVRRAFEEGKIGFSMDDPDAVESLINDLSRVKYLYDAKGRMVIDKFGLGPGHSERMLAPDDRAARSPDRADSFVLAYGALGERFAMVKPKPQAYHSFKVGMINA